MRRAGTKGFVCLLFLSSFLMIGAREASRAQDPGPARLLQSAQASIERGALDEAARLLEQALAFDAGHKAARLALSHVLIRLARLPEAEKHVQLLRDDFPDEPEPLFLSALLAFQHGRMEQVCALTEQGLARGDKRAEVYKLLALAEYLLSRLEKFETHIQAAIRLNPLDADAHYHLGRYYFEDKRYREALAAFQMTLKLQPEHYRARYYSGLVREGENEGDLAKEDFQAAIEIIDRQRVRYAWPFTDLGRRLLYEGEYERAIGWFYRGVRNDPASPHAKYHYAKALFQKGAGFEVKEALEAAIRLDPGYSEAVYLLARYYQQTGEKQLARETFDRFEELKRNPLPSHFGLRR
ncbi:MAG: tetratricopeptide repeat protein [Blastocatellia bacterium]